LIEAYAIGVAAKLEDGVTPSLLRIIEALGKANESMLAFSANVRRMSAASGTLATSMGRAAKASVALGDSSAGLTRASYVLDQMAVSSADVARNLAAAKGAGAAMVTTPGGSPNEPRAVVASGTSHSKGILAASLLYGLYENAKLGDINAVAAVTSQTSDIAGYVSALRDREFAYARQYGFATGGGIKPFAESMLEGARMLRTLPQKQQIQMMDMAMPYIATEAKLKGVSLPESTLAFIGLAHQAGAYTPEKAGPLFESMLQASLTTHASLAQITRAASYALPSLNAAGANAPDVMMMLATMMQAGILNTKSGTWLNNLALNALPNTLGSGLFKNKMQNEALHSLGLYKGNQSMFYKNGKLDLMTLVSILAEDRMHMSAESFNAATRQGFGIQGQRAASLFSEDFILKNLKTLADLKNMAPSATKVGDLVKEFSTVAKADMTIANANMTFMNATAVLTPIANAILDKVSSALGYASGHPEGAVAGGLAGIGAPVWVKVLQRSIEAIEVKVHNYIDGREIAAHVIPDKAHGPTGFNRAAMAPHPGSN